MNIAKGVSLILVAVLLVALYMTYSWANDSIKSLNKDVDSLENNLEATQIEFDDYKNRSAETISEKNREIALKDASMDSLESEVSSLENTVIGLETDVINLEAQTKQWQDRYSEAYAALQSTSKQLQQAASELNYLRDLTSQAYSDLRNLFSWVKDNAYLDMNIQSSANSKCGNPTTKSGTECTIDTYDLGHYMANCFSYGSEVDQRISSCNEFWHDKVGDCDDYALFAAAWLRSEIDDARFECDTNWVTMQNKPDSQCASKGCYKEKRAGSAKEVFVVCGGLTKSAAALFGAKEGSGHCEVGISSYTPFSPNSEEHLKKMNVFEPQSGTYNGKVEDEFKVLYAIISQDDIVFYNGWDIDYKLSDIKDDYEDFMDTYDFD